MKLIITIFIFFGMFSASIAEKNNFFDEAKMLFEKEKYEKSKFLFQRNIVYNPKDAKSYLYLAKIFSLEEDKIEEKKYINTTLLLEPKNEEAMYMLIEIELKRSNFSKVKELKKDFKEICSTLCEKLTSINIRLKEFEKKDES